MSRKSPVVLGIDPGTATTGFGVITEKEGSLQALAFGVITTPAADPLPARLVTIHEALTGLIAQHRPDAVAVEELFFAKNARTALVVGHARGVVLLAIAQAHAPLFQYKPSQVKQAVSGYGAADKRQVQEMVRLLLGLEDIPRPDDAADALAIAICHFHSAQYSVISDQ